MEHVEEGKGGGYKGNVWIMYLMSSLREILKVIEFLKFCHERCYDIVIL